MAQTALVEMQIQEGCRLIDRLLQDKVALVAASWVKESESDQWFLYLATPLVSEDGATRAAYRRVNASIRDMRQEGIWIEPLDIKLIGPNDPSAIDVLAQRAKKPTWFRGNRLGELAVEDAYIYPPILHI